MGAYSTTGTGNGSAEYLTNQQLTNIAFGPANIIYVGYTETDEEIITSPPSSISIVNFPTTLYGGSENYAVFLTSINGGTTYIGEMLEDDSGNFSGFICNSEYPSNVMYMVVKTGTKLV